MRLPAVAATIEEARYQARKSGRPYIAAADISDAIFGYQIPSNQALQLAFQPDEKQRGVAFPIMADSGLAAVVQRLCNRIE